MNPILLEFLSSVARWALALAAGMLVKHGVIEGGAAERYVNAASSWFIVTGVMVAPLVWAYFKARMHIKEIKVGIAGPSNATVADVKEIAKLPDPQ